MRSKVVREGDRILHLPYTRLVEDPVAAAVEIFERFDQPVDDDALSGMHECEAANPQHRWGRHAYDLERFGLVPQDIRSRYAEYASRFIATGGGRERGPSGPD